MPNETSDEIIAPPATYEHILKNFERQLRNGEKVPPISVRELLRLVGAQRRGSSNNFLIRSALSDAHLATVPDFTVPYIDAVVEFRLADETASGAGVADTGSSHAAVGVRKNGGTDAELATSASSAVDPTYRIGRLRAANVVPTCVKPNQTVTEAITIMLTNDFSQLPVMAGEREVKGVISWGSIGSRLVLGVKMNEVRKCMEPPHIITEDTSLFDAITEIVNHQYVLVRDGTNKISGIVTTSDLSLEFRQLTEPFVLLGEIENHVRSLIQRGAFTNAELRNCSDPNVSDRPINGIFDLTFGDYLRLLEQKDFWSRLNLSIDRTIFIDKLDEIRRVRNDVMHFDPDGITESELDALRKFAGFLQKLQPILRQ
jgi:CBS domain-containing protein